MKTDPAMARARESARELSNALERLAQSHPEEQDIYHLANTLAQQSNDSASALDDGSDPRLPQLLADLREVHLLAAQASIDWTILGQGAQAARDQELLGAVSSGHEATLKILKWTTTRLKEATPQALS
jgi:hypothetical protein